jgi:hypothetical protein
MIDLRRTEVRSIEQLIETLHPIQISAIRSERFDTTLSELRQMRNNITAVLAFTCHSESAGEETELRRVVDEVRRECLLINGMISRIMFRKRWLFSVSKIEETCEVLAHYKDLTRAARRMCRIVAPEQDRNLLNAF